MFGYMCKVVASFGIWNSSEISSSSMESVISESLSPLSCSPLLTDVVTFLFSPSAFCWQAVTFSCPWRLSRMFGCGRCDLHSGTSARPWESRSSEAGMSMYCVTYEGHPLGSCWSRDWGVSQKNRWDAGRGLCLFSLISSSSHDVNSSENCL